MTATGFATARFADLFPVDAAIVTGTHSGMGGAGDIAVPSAGDRTSPMPFARIATWIGGITVTLALIAIAAPR